MSLDRVFPEVAMIRRILPLLLLVLATPVVVAQQPGGARPGYEIQPRSPGGQGFFQGLQGFRPFGGGGPAGPTAADIPQSPELEVPAPRIEWLGNLDEARGIAARSQRLVLLHFYSDTCPPCRLLERNVFPVPEVAVAVQQAYVPVKINTAHHPDLTQLYHISSIPTDVIVDAQGKELSRTISPPDPARYVRMLEGAAGAYFASLPRGPENPAALEGWPPSRSAYNTSPGLPASPAGLVAHPPGVAPSIETPPYAETLPDTIGPATAPTGPAMQAPTYQQPTYGQYEESSVYAVDQPVTTRPAPGAIAFSPAQSASAFPPPPEGYPTNLPGITVNPYVGERTAAAPQAPTAGLVAASAAERETYAPLAAAPSPSSPGVPGYARDWAQPAAPQLTAAAPEPAAALEPAATLEPVATAAPSRSRPADVTLGGSGVQIGLDGYCPVTLMSQGDWVRGSRQWGAIHRGRTYLFASAEAQQQFLGDPDAYSPALSGYDPVEFRRSGRLVSGNRRHGIVHFGQMFLFANEQSLAEFKASPDEYIHSIREATARADAALRR